ncbi:MAG: transcription initiation factor IIB [Candidatus Nezhaarchaeota archaeon]|nr:transcription initiation factor IIB [Candidatus Nezhaarchaeota archaeon]
MSSQAQAEKKAPPTCPECGGHLFKKDYERGELTCSNCGLVLIEKIIDRGPEWRAFTPEEKERRSRAGPPSSSPLIDRDLTTVIEYMGKDASGHKLEPKRVLEVLRWRRWQIRSRVQSSLDRNIQQAAQHLERIAFYLNLPASVREEAIGVYRKAIDAGLVRGRSIESIMAASIYAACRKLRVPRTLEEIAQYTKAGRKDMARCYRLLLRYIRLGIPVADAADFVPRIGAELGLSGTLQRKAVEIINEARKLGITAGKDPAGLAAAAIYIASLQTDERKTQKEIARAAQVTEVTVRNRYKELAKKLNIQVSL